MEPNQQNKQEKQNQRHGNKEQTDSNQSGVGGDNGGRKRKVFRNIYKVHVGKTKAGVGSRVGSGDGWGWGEW